MKKPFFLAVALCSFNAVSAPYIGLEVGHRHVNSDVDVVFSDGKKLGIDTNFRDSTWSGYVGYSFTDSWGVELGYSEYTAQNEDSSMLASFGSYRLGNSYKIKTEVEQFYLAPVYTYQVDKSLSLNLKGGLTYSDYEFHGKHVRKLYPLLDAITYKTQEAKKLLSTDEFGAFVAVGAYVHPTDHFRLGISAKYQIDRASSFVSYNLGASYHF